jgi:hypothetical protein
LLGHCCCIALEGGALADKAQLYRPALLLEQAGNDKAIAAIIAWPAQHQHRALIIALHDGLGDGLARRLHQLERLDASLHGQAIGLHHLSRREQDV